MMNEIRFEQLKLQLDRLHLILTNPKDHRVLLLLLGDLQQKRIKCSKVTAKWLRTLFKRSRSDSLSKAGVKSRVDKANRLERIRESRRALYQNPSKLNDFLRKRFEWNKKVGWSQGEWKLTDEDIEWLFNIVVSKRNPPVRLGDIGQQVRLVRHDVTKPVELSNLKVMRKKRRSCKKKRVKKSQRKVSQMVLDVRKYLKRNPR